MDPAQVQKLYSQLVSATQDAATSSGERIQGGQNTRTPGAFRAQVSGGVGGDNYNRFIRPVVKPIIADIQFTAGVAKAEAQAESEYNAAQDRYTAAKADYVAREKAAAQAAYQAQAQTSQSSGGSSSGSAQTTAGAGGYTHVYKDNGDGTYYDSNGYLYNSAGPVQGGNAAAPLQPQQAQAQAGYGDYVDANSSAQSARDTIEDYLRYGKYDHEVIKQKVSAQLGRPLTEAEAREIENTNLGGPGGAFGDYENTTDIDG